MEDKAEREARSAAQGLLDIAIKASKRPLEPQSSQGHEQGAVRDMRASSSSSAANLSRPSGSSGIGRLVTSGDYSPAMRHKEESTGLPQSTDPGKKEFAEPKPKKAEERVTVIVQKPVEDKDREKGKPGARMAEAEPIGIRKQSADIPVPPSAFAALVGSGDSARSSADFSPFSRGTVPARDSHVDAREKLDEEKAEEGAERPQKKQKMTRTVSINTVLQRVGSAGQPPLADAVGNPPRTVQEFVSKAQPGSASKPEVMEIAEPAPKAQPHGTALISAIMPRNSSDQSTMDIQRQIAQAQSSETVQPRPALKGQRSSHGMERSFSAERDLHRRSKTPPPNTNNGKLDLSPTQTLASRDSGEETETVMWNGEVKHLLRTAEGASVAHLFSLQALVPTKLMEQLPPTIFVNALVGRANVKLGKHYVAQCRVGQMTDRQLQKVTALATMKIVAICELQHCTLTLVPYMTAEQELRMVAFMIADD